MFFFYIKCSNNIEYLIKFNFLESVASRLNDSYNKLVLLNNIKSPLTKISQFMGLTYNSVRNYSTRINNIKYSTAAAL